MVTFKTYIVSQSRKESDVEDIHESTHDAEFEKKDIVMEKYCDVSSVDENSRDLFKTPQVDESFGFNMLSGMILGFDWEVASNRYTQVELNDLCYLPDDTKVCKTSHTPQKVI